MAKLRKMRLGEKKKYSLYSNPRIKATIPFRCSSIFFFPKVNCLGIFSEVGLDTIAN